MCVFVCVCVSKFLKFENQFRNQKGCANKNQAEFSLTKKKKKNLHGWPIWTACKAISDLAEK